MEMQDFILEKNLDFVRCLFKNEIFLDKLFSNSECKKSLEIYLKKSENTIRDELVENKQEDSKNEESTQNKVEILKKTLESDKQIDSDDAEDETPLIDKRSLQNICQWCIVKRNVKHPRPCKIEYVCDTCQGRHPEEFCIIKCMCCGLPNHSAFYCRHLCDNSNCSKTDWHDKKHCPQTFVKTMCGLCGKENHSANKCYHKCNICKESEIHDKKNCKNKCKICGKGGHVVENCNYKKN